MCVIDLLLYIKENVQMQRVNVDFLIHGVYFFYKKIKKKRKAQVPN